MKKKIFSLVGLLVAFSMLFSMVQVCADEATKKIAFVGDSITWGAGVTDRETESFPALAASKLGAGYEVGNFGVSSTSALSTAKKPYTDTEEYKASLEFGADILFIMLGTNDIKYENWTDGKDNFESDYAAIINSYKEVNPRVKVYVGIPPRIFKENVFGERSPEILEKEGIPAVYNVAEAVGAKTIDFFTASKDKPEMFTDFLHPNADGHKLFADLVYESISEDESKAALIAEGASEWAKEEVILSYSAGIMPERIAGNYQTDITREEFCEMVVNMLPANLEASRIAAFSDCDNAAVKYAYSVGVVNGMSDSEFAPGAKATREEMAAMLYRAYKLIVPQALPTVSGEYPDKNLISDWALESVNFMNESGIMLGDDAGNIMPKQNTTREQAILLVYRAYRSAYSYDK